MNVFRVIIIGIFTGVIGTFIGAIIAFLAGEVMGVCLTMDTASKENILPDAQARRLSELVEDEFTLKEDFYPKCRKKLEKIRERTQRVKNI